MEKTNSLKPNDLFSEIGKPQTNYTINNIRLDYKSKSSSIKPENINSPIKTLVPNNGCNPETKTTKRSLPYYGVNILDDIDYFTHIESIKLCSSVDWSEWVLQTIEDPWAKR